MPNSSTSIALVGADPAPYAVRVAAARRVAHETARRVGEDAGVRVDGRLLGWMTPAGEFVPAIEAA